MGELQVEIPRLRAFGTQFHTFGTSNVGQTGRTTRVDAGQTSDMDGLLDIIAPAIHETAVVFGNHYEAVARVVAGTGTALVKTADDYAKVDRAVAQAVDAKAVQVGSRHDEPIGSGGAWSEHHVYATRHAIDPDPATKIREGLDADVRAIDWVFHEFTGHHITEPIDQIVGNWTTLTARGESWADVSRMLKAHGDDVLANTANVDAVWDGVAATSFHEFGVRLGNGLHAESEIPLAIQDALGQLADTWETLYHQCVDLLQSVVHDVEIGAVALAAGWWCGVGEAVAAKKCEEALVAFYRAYKIVMLVKHLVTAADLAVKGLAKLADLSHLGDTPSRPYGGPSAPATPDPRRDVDSRAATDAVLEPLRAEGDRVDRELADNRRFLDQRRGQRLDAETRELLTRAAESPQAPVSLRRLARRIAGGELTWDDVLARRAGAEGEAFVAEAFRTAEQHVADAEVAPVKVPAAAVETGIDPDEVAADIDRTRREARAEHDAVFRRAFEGDR